MKYGGSSCTSDCTWLGTLSLNTLRRRTGGNDGA
jgi:hypothetical protein